MFAPHLTSNSKKIYKFLKKVKKYIVDI